MKSYVDRVVERGLITTGWEGVVEFRCHGTCVPPPQPEYQSIATMELQPYLDEHIFLPGLRRFLDGAFRMCTEMERTSEAAASIDKLTSLWIKKYGDPNGEAVGAVIEALQ